MRGQCAVGIVAHDLHIDLSAQETVSIDRQGRDFLIGQGELEDHRFKRTPRALQAVVKVLDLLFTDRGDGGQCFNEAVEVFDAFAYQRQIEDGTVFRQQVAPAVEDEAPDRRHGHHLHAVFLGTGLVVLVLQHLQMEHPGH